MTRQAPDPGQIPQIQVPGVSAQPIGGVRPASPPPPDLSRLQRFASLSQSVGRFLDAYGDNDRIKSQQEAAIAFQELDEETRNKLNSGSPEERLDALNAHFDKLSKEGIIHRADHPRFRAFFREEALRGEVNDLNRRLEARISEAQAVYDENGSLVGEADPEAIFAEEMEGLEGTFAFGDAFARRQVGEEIVQTRERFLNAFSSARAQALEQAARDQVKDQAFEFASEVVAQALGGGVPISEADLSPLVRIMENAKTKYGETDSRRIVVDGVATVVGRLRDSNRFGEALEWMDRLETFRDSSRNLVVRDADTSARLSGLREALEREDEQQNDRDIRNRAIERQENLQRGQGEILRHIFVGQEQGADLSQIRESRYNLILRNYRDEGIQGELLSFMETELRRAEDRSLTSDVPTLQRLRQMSIGGTLTVDAVIDASDDLSWNDTKELLQAADDQAGARNAYPAEVRQLVDATSSFFAIPGAPYSEQTRLLTLGSERVGELHRRLQAAWLASEGQPEIDRRQALRGVAFDFEKESREILDAERTEYQSRVSSAMSELTSRGLALTEAEVLQYANTLPTEFLDDWKNRAINVSARVADQRSKAEGAAIGRASRLLDQYLIRNPDLEDFGAEVLETFTQQIYEEFDRFEQEELPNLPGSQVFAGYRNAARRIIQESIIPQVSPLLDTVQDRVGSGQAPDEALEQTAREFQGPDSVDLTRYPELSRWAALDKADAEARYEAVSKAILGAPPERQPDLFLQAAQRMGIKAEEVLNGQARLLGSRVVSTGLGPLRVSADRYLPIEFLAQSRAKYLIPLFTSTEELSTFVNRQEDMERLMERLDIPESDWATWLQIQKQRIRLIHGE